MTFSPMQCELYVVALHRTGCHHAAESGSESRASAVSEQRFAGSESGCRELRGRPAANLQRHDRGEDAELRESHNEGDSVGLVVLVDLHSEDRSSFESHRGFGCRSERISGKFRNAASQPDRCQSLWRSQLTHELLQQGGFCDARCRHVRKCRRIQRHWSPVLGMG